MINLCWNVKRDNWNARKAENYNILNESLIKEIKKLKKQYKANDDFKAFSEVLRRELQWQYWAKAEWELTVTKDEDDRIILCDLFENKTIPINENISVDEIKKMVDLINNLLVGTLIDEVNKKLEFEIKPIIGKYIKQQEAIYNMFYNAFNEIASRKENYHFSGKSNILRAPEFNDVDKIRSIVAKFEDGTVVNNIEETSNGINVYIGEETNIDNDVTVIKTRYVVNGNEGTIAIVGPKRMDYEKVVSMLDFIKKEIEKK